MSDNHARPIDDAPMPAYGPNVRLNLAIEPEAATMLDELARRLYPSKRVSTARALVIEMAVRALHKRVTTGGGHDGATHL